MPNHIMNRLRLKGDQNRIDELLKSVKGKDSIRCRDFLDEQIAKCFDGMTLPSDCVENTVKEFGYDRTMWVIANTIQNRKGDGRFHRQNTEWAKALLKAELPI